MRHSIAVPEDLYLRLKELAAFAKCEPAEVVRRLLDSLREDQEGRQPAFARSANVVDPTLLGARPPRERGVRVELNGQVLDAVSVPDLYEKTLRVIAKRDRERMRSLLPYKTSAHRFLIAEKPKHPNGKPFFVPIEHDGFYMEAHKSYHTAVSQLADFLSKLGISFRYLP